MIEDEVKVDDFCRQTVLHRLATMIYHIRNWIKYNLTRVEFKFKTAKAYFVRDDKREAQNVILNNIFCKSSGSGDIRGLQTFA